MNTTDNATGTPNTTYNVVSVLYHALQGAETCERYIQDAERDGNQELAGFFREMQQLNRQCSQRAEEMLAKHLPRR